MVNIKPAFFINIEGQIVDTNRNIIENHTGSLPTEIIDNICKIGSKLYHIIVVANNTYELHKIELSGSDNYIVDEFTNNYVKINDIIHHITKNLNGTSMTISKINTNIVPDSIHNIVNRDVIYRGDNDWLIYISSYIFVDTCANLVICNERNPECIIIKKNINCNRIYFIKNGTIYYHGNGICVFTLILFYDNAIEMLSYDMHETCIANNIMNTSFVINKIYFNNMSRWKIIDSNHDVYDMFIDPFISDIKITPLHLKCGVTDIIYYRSDDSDCYLYLSTERLLYDSEGKILTCESLTRKITVATKSANFICNS